MLIRFNVANFLSFDEETEFNMLAAKSLRTHKEHVYSVKKDLDVLKASAIYGANGAGKSNLIKAIRNLKEIVNKGVISSDISDKKFRINTENRSKPIYHEIEFSINKQIYTYGINYDNDIILDEWLYETGTAKAKIIFERTHSKSKKHPIIKVADKYVESEKAKMRISIMEEDILKQNQLLISQNSTLKIDEINDVLEWIQKKMIIIFPNTTNENIAATLYKNDIFRNFSETTLKSFDTGIDALELKSEPLDEYLTKSRTIKMNDLDGLKKHLDKGKMAKLSPFNSLTMAIKEEDKYMVKKFLMSHKDVPFGTEEESDGTRRLIDFIPLLFSILNQEITYIIDEIDRSLHPSMLHTLIKKIMDDNTTKGQLIFTTHESSLLNCKIFRSDEIWFAEKNRTTQSTELYTLNEFKPRPDLDIEKGYLNGRFGAIPFLSKLEDLNWHEQ